MMDIRHNFFPVYFLSACFVCESIKYALNILHNAKNGYKQAGHFQSNKIGAPLLSVKYELHSWICQKGSLFVI